MKTSFADRLRQFLPAVIIHLAVIGAWYLWVTIGDVPTYVMPSPYATLMALNEEYNWFHHTLITGGEVFLGYTLAVAFGVFLALAFSWSRMLNTTLMPLVVTTNMIPKVALGPLFIVWFSYGFMPNVIIAFSICFLPILLTTSRGMREVEPELIDLVRSLKGSKWQIFTKIQLPGSLPYIFSGMKVAVVLAVAGAVVGEFIASEEGLGYLMLQVQVNLDTGAMFMAVLLITVIGILLYGIVLGLERIFVVGDQRLEAGA